MVISDAVERLRAHCHQTERFMRREGRAMPGYRRLGEFVALCEDVITAFDKASPPPRDV